jgi:hypothetical protein
MAAWSSHKAGCAAMAATSNRCKPTAKSALDRIVIPPDVLDRIAGMAPRSSLIITDEALSSETGNGTDFVVLLSGEPQGGIKIRRRAPAAEFGYARPRDRLPMGAPLSRVGFPPGEPASATVRIHRAHLSLERTHVVEPLQLSGSLLSDGTTLFRSGWTLVVDDVAVGSCSVRCR